MAALSSETVHATTIAIGGQAVLLQGPSGSGKSDLALRLIDRGAVLVSDDYTLLVRDGARLKARAPATIAGRLEVRHVGLVSLPFEDDVPVALAVQLGETPERLPDHSARAHFAGIAVPAAILIATEASAPIKVELLLQLALGGDQSA